MTLLLPFLLLILSLFLLFPLNINRPFNLFKNGIPFKIAHDLLNRLQLLKLLRPLALMLVEIDVILRLVLSMSFCRITALGYQA